MSWLLAAALAVILVEILAALPLLPEAGRLLATVTKVQRTIASPRISDHWKEKVLVAYAGTMLRKSLTIFALMLCMAGAVALAGYGVALAFDSGFPAFMLSLEGTLFITAASLAYAFARFRLVPRVL